MYRFPDWVNMLLFKFLLLQKKSPVIQRHRPVSSDYKLNLHYSNRPPSLRILLENGLDSWINVNALFGKAELIIWDWLHLIRKALLLLQMNITEIIP